MKKTFREEILGVLSEPSTVTEIKNKIPRIKSFGTLAYHLKILEKEKVITKEKQKKKQGQPTTYKIVSNKVKASAEEYNRKFSRHFLEVLNMIDKNPNLNQNDLYNRLMEKGLDMGYIGDALTDAYNENYTILSSKITEKGKQFLKENSK